MTIIANAGKAVSGLRDTRQPLNCSTPERVLPQKPDWFLHQTSGKDRIKGICYSLLIITVILTHLATTIHAGERISRTSPVRIAVLDFNSPTTAPWLGAAVSAAIRSKLTGIDNVDLLERRNMQNIIQAGNTQAETRHQNKITASLLGVEYLLTGSVQIIGKWTSRTTKLRLSAKIISAETTGIWGDAAFIFDGAVSDLFTMETNLADRFTKAINIKLSVLQAEYREAQNLTAKRLFGQGLHALQKAEKLIASGLVDSRATDTPKNKKRTSRNNELGSRNPAQTAHLQIINKREHNRLLLLLQSAADFFRQAQNQNKGVFYARAHHYEGRVRELLAVSQIDSAKTVKIRDATISQFRQDAATAAPALYDLANALQANDRIKEAIAVYHDFLKWINDSRRFLRWKDGGEYGTFLSVVENGRWPEQYEETAIGGSRDYLLQVKTQRKRNNSHRLICRDHHTGNRLWALSLPMRSPWKNTQSTASAGMWEMSREKNPVRCMPTDQIVAQVVNKTVYVLADERFIMLNAKNGQVLLDTILPLPRLVQQRARICLRYEPRIHVPPESDRYVAVWRCWAQGIRSRKTRKYVIEKEANGCVIIDTKNSKVLWTRKGDKQYRIWNQTVFTGDRLAKCYDLSSGQDITNRYPQKIRDLISRGILLSSRIIPKIMYIVYPAGTDPETPQRKTTRQSVWLVRATPEIHIEALSDYLFFGPWKCDSFGMWQWQLQAGKKNQAYVWDSNDQKYHKIKLPKHIAKTNPAQLITAVKGNIWLLRRPEIGVQDIYKPDGTLLNTWRQGWRYSEYLIGPGKTVTCFSTRGLRNMIGSYRRRKSLHKITNVGFGMSVQMKQSAISARLRLAECKLKLREPSKALAELDHVFDATGDRAYAYWLAGEAYLRLHYWIEAANTYRTCARLLPDTSPLKAKAEANAQDALPIWFRIPGRSKRNVYPAEALSAFADKQSLTDVYVIFENDRLIIRNNRSPAEHTRYRVIDLSNRRTAIDVDSPAGNQIVVEKAGIALVPLHDRKIWLLDANQGVIQTIRHDAPKDSILLFDSNTAISCNAKTWIQAGILLWTSTEKQQGKVHYYTHLSATDLNSGKLLWSKKGIYLNHPYTGILHIKGKLILSSPSIKNPPQWELLSYDIRSGIRLNHLSVSHAGSSQPGIMPPFLMILHQNIWEGWSVYTSILDRTNNCAVIQTRAYANGPVIHKWRYSADGYIHLSMTHPFWYFSRHYPWNGWIICQNRNGSQFYLDPASFETGSFHPMAAATISARAGLKGAERISAAKNPAKYRRKYPVLAPIYLGEHPDSGPQIRRISLRQKDMIFFLIAADGRKIGQIPPIDGCRHPSVTKHFILFDRQIVLRKNDFLRLYGLDTQNRN